MQYFVMHVCWLAAVSEFPEARVTEVRGWGRHRLGALRKFSHFTDAIIFFVNARSDEISDWKKDENSVRRRRRQWGSGELRARGRNPAGHGVFSRRALQATNERMRIKKRRQKRTSPERESAQTKKDETTARGEVGDGGGRPGAARLWVIIWIFLNVYANYPLHPLAARTQRNAKQNKLKRNESKIRAGGGWKGGGGAQDALGNGNTSKILAGIERARTCRTRMQMQTSRN